MPEPQSLLAKLPLKRRKFVRLMLKHPERAAKNFVEAGYAPKNAATDCHKLLKIPSVAAALVALRAETEITIARNTVADMLELEEHFTAELRGDAYFARIARLERRLESREKALAVLQEAAATPNLNPLEKAMLSAKILEATERIFDSEAQIAQIHISGRNESNKAGVTLLKLKGAFDPRRPPVDDPMALLNEVARNILRAKVKPSQILETMRAQAKDATFSVGAGNDPADARPSPGGTGEAGRDHLFYRARPKPAAT